jgi:hypothetical protein
MLSMPRGPWPSTLATFHHARYMSFLPQSLQKQPGPLQTSTNMFEGSINDNRFIKEAKAST